jgi:hypothetical protein
VVSPTIDSIFSSLNNTILSREILIKSTTATATEYSQNPIAAFCKFKCGNKQEKNNRATDTDRHTFKLGRDGDFQDIEIIRLDLNQISFHR